MPSHRRFLFLQGPVGPFMGQLAARLRARGAQVWRVGFNAGDAAFWPDRASYIAFRERPEAWPATCAALLARHAITDLVLLGDMRPLHAQAIAEARAAGVAVHVLEEGYLRPWWITYERGGTNARSALMEMPLSAMRAALPPEARRADATPPPPARWGELRQHVYWGMIYHALVMLGRRRYPHHAPHRGVPVRTELAAHARRLAMLPALAAARRLTLRRLTRQGLRYHLVLLQLDHDASFQADGPYPSGAAFAAACLQAFAAAAPPGDHLVFKAHPLEDGRAGTARTIAQTAGRLGLGGRVHHMGGAALAGLLDGARSVVTVTSTGAQQALWRGLPVKAMGRAIYARPEIVSCQDLADFFANPAPPNPEAYATLRAFLMAQCQLAGGFYSTRGRARVLSALTDRLLAEP